MNSPVYHGNYIYLDKLIVEFKGFKGIEFPVGRAATYGYNYL